MALTARLNRRVREWLDGTRSSSGNPFPMGLREWKDLDLASRLDELAALGESGEDVGSELVVFDPQSSGINGTTVGDALRELRALIDVMAGGPIDASIVTYDNDASGLPGTNAQAAIDELAVLVGTAQSTATAAGVTASAAASAASGAQSTANTGVTNAATAQGTANTGVTNAATAQGTANGAVSSIATLIADLASVLVSKGAALIGINDTGGIITATTVEAALQEIKAALTTAINNLASVANGKGASLVGIEDAALVYAATTVEAALAELRTGVVFSTPKVYPEGPGSAIYAGTRQDDFFDPPWDGAILSQVRVTPINGVSVPTSGSYKFTIDKIPWDGTGTAVTLLRTGTDYTPTLVNKTPNVADAVTGGSPVLAASAVTRAIALGSCVRIGINSDAIALFSTNGSGLLVTCGWSRT